MRELVQDVAYFARSMARTPGFFAVAVLTLALGIGASTAIFSVVNAVLLRPLPFREPDRLVRLFQTEASPGQYPFTGPDYMDMKAQNHTLEATALLTWYRRVNVSGGGETDTAAAVGVEASFFDVLGVRPLLGRTFLRGENASGGARVAVVSYGVWQRRFGGRAAVVDSSIVLDAERYTIVGVMPAGFDYPRDTEIWIPMDMSPAGLGPRGSHSFLAPGRLRPGASLEQALADLRLIATRLERQYPDTNDHVGAAVVSMKDQLTRRAREPLLVLLGAVTLVLLVACANVANLLLIRAGGRRRELAIRAAIGAGRGRVARQLLTESVALSLAGGAAGLAAAWWGVGLLRSVDSLPIPILNPVRIDARVLLFSVSAALLTGLLFGLLPAVQASTVRPNEELNATGHGAGRFGRRAARLRDLVAVAEVAVSLALLAGAGLMIRTVANMRHAGIGADTRRVLTASISLPRAAYRTVAAQQALFDRLAERIGSTPGVRAVAVSTHIPLEGGSNGYITVPGEDSARLANQLFEWNYVTPDYFRVFGIRLIEGRTFTGAEDRGAAADAVRLQAIFSVPNPRLDGVAPISWPVVVNRTMARIIWGDRDPIGREFVMGDVIRARVVGVSADTTINSVRDAALPQACFPFGGSLGAQPGGYVSVAAAADPARLLAPIRSHLRAIDPALALADARTMDEVVAGGARDEGLVAWLLGVFAAVAAVMAAVGLYSVMAFLVAQRRRELGIRLAVGAAPKDLWRLIAGHAAALVAAGLAAGFALWLWLSRLLAGLVFGLAPRDPITLLAVAGFLALAALAATAIPARRAMTVDPAAALRLE